LLERFDFRISFWIVWLKLVEEMLFGRKPLGQGGFSTRNLPPLKETISRVFQFAIGGLDPRIKTLFRYRLLGLAFVVGISVFFIPANFYNPPDFGLDSSWRLILNRAFSQSWEFGSQLIWTYGPLGILEARLPYGVNQLYYVAYDLLVLCLFLRLTLDVARLQLDTKLVLACVAMLACVKNLITVLPSSAFYCLIVFLIVRNLRQPEVFSSIALVLTSTAMVFFKMNFGLVGVFLSCAILLYRTVERNQQAYVWAAIVVSQVLLAILLSQHFHTNLIQYISTSLILVRQYNDGMSGSSGRGSVSHIAVCLFFATYLAMAAAFVRKHRFRDFVYLFVSTAALFVLFKTAIVRSDYLYHNKCFVFGFPVVALIFFTHGPETMRKLWRLLFLTSATYAGMLLLAEHGHCLIYMRTEYVKAFLPVDYLREFANYNSNCEWNSYRDFVRNSSSERCLPENVKTLIGNNRVDIFPYEGSLPLGSTVNYRPRPIPQSYAAFGPTLEARNEADFRSAHAPPFLLYVVGQKAGSVDGRYPLWDEPALKRLIQNDYRCQLVFTNILGSTSDPPISASQILLLNRKPSPEVWKPIVLTTQTEAAFEDLSIPQFAGELYAKILLKKTVFGKLSGLFYRGGKVNARFELQDGTTKKLRIIPANLQNGVLVNYFVDQSDAQGLTNYLCDHSRGNAKCLHVEIEFENPWEYCSRFDVSYFYLSSSRDTGVQTVLP
jgi:hypothetical protein